MRADDYLLNEKELELKIKTLKGGVEGFQIDIENLPSSDTMRFFLQGVIKAFDTSITGLSNVGVGVTLEEIVMNFLPNAEERAYLMSQEGFIEREHYFMGMVWGFDEVIDFISPYSSGFQRHFESEQRNLIKDIEKGTLTRKEMKMVFMYPLIVGFIGGTIANIASNYLTVRYLKHKEII